MRVPGVGGDARDLCAFYFFVTLRNRKKSSKTHPITTKVCRSKNNFSRYHGLAGNVLSRSIPFLPCRHLVIQRVTGVKGGARTARGEAYLSAAARRRTDSRRCIWLR